MRRYDELVAVRKGLIDGMEGPEQFLWQGQLWQVRAVVSRWVQTPPWWEHRAIRGLLGAATTPADAASPDGDLPVTSIATLVADQEVWRVDASRGRLGLLRPDDREVRGVFDLVLDTQTGDWRLIGCQD